MPVLTKIGKCKTCAVKVREEREFKPLVGLFDTGGETWLRGPVAAAIQKWRYKTIYCKEHEREAKSMDVGKTKQPGVGGESQQLLL